MLPLKIWILDFALSTKNAIVLLNYEKVCPVCKREVQNDEIIKGYEYEPGKYVVISNEELQEIAPESNRTIEIIDFVKLDEIDPIFFEKSYHILK